MRFVESEVRALGGRRDGYDVVFIISSSGKHSIESGHICIWPYEYPVNSFHASVLAMPNSYD